MSMSTPYATALFSAATEAKRLREVDNDLAAIAGAVRENAALSRTLANPAISREEKTRVFAALCKGGDPLVVRFRVRSLTAYGSPRTNWPSN